MSLFDARAFGTVAACRKRRHRAHHGALTVAGPRPVRTCRCDLFHALFIVSPDPSTLLTVRRTASQAPSSLLSKAHQPRIPTPQQSLGELLTRPPQAIDLKTAVVGLHWRINARFVENHRRSPGRRAIRERDTVANTVKTRSNSVLDTVTTVTRRKDHRAQRHSPCGRSLLAWNQLPEEPFAMSGSRWTPPESWPEPA